MLSIRKMMSLFPTVVTEKEKKNDTIKKEVWVFLLFF